MEKKWWHNHVVYQIYPRSFNDTTGSGVGDINGIIEKLDYLALLGIDIIWLSPIYKSPMDDNGYDISDYQMVDPLFGSNEDLDRLIEEGKKRNIGIMMDLVVNHTSDEHPWFIESKSSLDNPKRDWYIWKKPKPDGSAPNNWAAYFTRSAWAYDETTGEYYLHLFSKKQPDLNWENSEVRRAVYDMMHYWLKKGIAGFRMDVINMIGKPKDYPDAYIHDGGVLGHEYWANNNRCHEYLREMYQEVLSKYDIVTVGETPYVLPMDGMKFSHPKRGELNMIFQFEHMSIDKDNEFGDRIPFDLVTLKQLMTKWQESLHGNGWNSLYWNNHDQPRVVSRFGDDTKYRVESAKMLGAVLHFMSGTPYIYQGEELGLTNTYYEHIDEYNDLYDHNKYDIMIHDRKMTHEDAMNNIRYFSRDNARVPMRWSEDEHAGFTTGTPWLQMNEDYKKVNAKAALEDENSVFYFYKNLIQLRKESSYSATIVYGKHQLLAPDDRDVYSYIRYDDHRRILIVANFTNQIVTRSFDETVKNLIISNYDLKTVDVQSLNLRPYEVVIVEI